MAEVTEDVVVAPPDVFHGELMREVGLRGLTMISLGSIIAIDAEAHVGDLLAEAPTGAA